MALVGSRVLFIVSQPYFQWRGSPIRVGFDVQALAELGYEVDLLVPPFGEEREVPGVTIHRVGHIPGVRHLPIGPSLAKLLFDFLLYRRARKLMQVHSYTVLHGVEDAGIVCALLARRAAVRFVFEKHSDPRSYKQGFFRNLIMALYAVVERWVIRRADAVIGTGPQLAAQAASLDARKPVVEIPDIPSSLVESTPEAALAARQGYVQHADEVLIVYVGSFAVYQGIDLLFASIPLVCLAAPNARFLVIGGSAAEIAARRCELEGRGVAGQVTFAGKVPPDELPAVLAGSDILLSPRIAGANTPLKLLDYLKAGRAIVATENAANRQILDDRTAVFAKAEPQAFAGAVIALAGNSALCSQLGDAGKHLLAGKYHFAYFKNALDTLYKLALE